MTKKTNSQTSAPTGVVIELNGFLLEQMDHLISEGLFDDRDQLMRDALGQFQPIVDCVPDSRKQKSTSFGKIKTI